MLAIIATSIFVSLCSQLEVSPSAKIWFYFLPHCSSFFPGKRVYLFVAVMLPWRFEVGAFLQQPTPFPSPVFRPLSTNTPPDRDFPATVFSRFSSSSLVVLIFEDVPF